MWNKPALLNTLSDILFIVGSAVLLALLCLWLLRVPSWAIRQVVFLGDMTHTDYADVAGVLPSLLRGNFLSLSVENLRQGLQKLPWVRKVSVRRIWPEKLEVRIEEHKAFAHWAVEGQDSGVLMNGFGEIFQTASKGALSADLPWLHGPEGTAKEVMQHYLTFSSLLKPLQQKPRSIVLTERLSWDMSLMNGMVLRLGRDQEKSPIHQRLQRFVAYSQSNPYPVMRAKTVDLRYPNGFSLQFSQSMQENIRLGAYREGNGEHE